MFSANVKVCLSLLKYMFKMGFYMFVSDFLAHFSIKTFPLWQTEVKLPCSVMINVVFEPKTFCLPTQVFNQ